MFAELFFAVDAWMIAPFRWANSAQVGFLLGTFILAVQCVLLGKLCLYCINWVHKRMGHNYEQEAARRHDLSMQALAEKNKTAYLAQNQLAQEAYGKSMSLAIGRTSASLWPAVMALAWMSIRFQHTPFPLPEWLPLGKAGVSYAFIFILVYIGARIAFGRLEAWGKRR
jgi:hypothetical protein